MAAVSRVQGPVSDQSPPEHIYQAVVDGAVALLDGDSGALRYVEQDDPGWMLAVASHASAGLGERWRQRAPITEGASGKVISTGRMVAVEGQRSDQTGCRRWSSFRLPRRPG